MKLMRFAAVALTMILFGGRAFGASDWTDWRPLQGHSGEKNDQIEGRSILDEASLQGGDSGYRFHYELRNVSSTETAKVVLHFPASNATITHELAPGGTATGSGLSPNSSQLDFQSQITWEEFKGTKEPGAPGSPEPGSSPATPGNSAVSRNPNDPVLGIPLTNKDALVAALANDTAHRYNAVLSFSKPTNYPDTQEGFARYVEDMEAWCDEGRQRYGWHIKVISTEGGWVQCLVENTDGSELSGFMQSALSVVRVLKLSRVGADGSEEAADNANQASSAPATPAFQGNGPLPSEKSTEKEQPWKASALPASPPKVAPATPAPPANAAPSGAHHEGYWFDPDDEAADDPDPMIYVRLGGVATRVRLSVAQRENGVPADATPENMTVYSEKLKKIITNRHTQKRR